MRGCVRCHYSNHCERHRRIKLVHRDSLAKAMWINEHVLHHYRPPKMSKRLCLQSMFHWTNETINIWSHVVGFLYFSYCQIERNFYSLPGIGGTAMDHAVITISLFGSQMCMLLSASFHIFGCQSARSRQKYLKLDLFGISAGILSMYTTGIYASFYCFEGHLSNYLGLILCLFIITGIVPFKKNSLERKVIGSRIGWVHIIYTSVVLLGLLPILHWITLHGGISADHVTTWLPNVLIVYTLTGSAFFFYVSLFPERLRPGTFDLVGCSHQWWHLLIFAAMAWFQESSIRLLQYYHLSGDFCQALSSPPLIPPLPGPMNQSSAAYLLK